MKLPPSIEAIRAERAKSFGAWSLDYFVQRIAAEACRLQKAKDRAFVPEGTRPFLDQESLIVEPPK